MTLPSEAGADAGVSDDSGDRVLAGVGASRPNVSTGRHKRDSDESTSRLASLAGLADFSIFRTAT